MQGAKDVATNVTHGKLCLATCDTVYITSTGKYNNCENLQILKTISKKNWIDNKDELKRFG